MTRRRDRPRLRLSLDDIYVLKPVITEDEGYPYFHPDADLGMLVVFLAQFERLGWLPPLGAAHIRLLNSFGVTAHQSGTDSLFYEFTSQGARGERNPWLCIFFHRTRSGRVRICGIVRTAFIRRNRPLVLARVRRRVNDLEYRLTHPTEEK